MNGKAKCRILKEIRRQIAEQNEIEWIVSECRHQGNCKGTCPKCEGEVRQLEKELECRRRLGKKVALAGISAAFLMGLAGCSMAGGAVTDPGGGDLAGDVTYIEPTEDMTDYAGEITCPEEPTNDGTELDGDVLETGYER